MSDMGWSRYIAAQDAAADKEMAADEAVSKLIADEGVRGLLERANKLRPGHWPKDRNRLAEIMWAAAGQYCIGHRDPTEWHPAPVCGLITELTPCDNCGGEREYDGQGGQTCYFCGRTTRPPAKSILDL